MSLFDYLGMKLDLNDLDTPQKYGAKADGVSDDYAAIAAMIEANQGKTVYFPAGVYCVSQPIKTHAENSLFTNLLLNPSAVVRPSAVMEYLLDYGGIGDRTGTPVKKYITGGMFDASNGKITSAVIHLDSHTSLVDLSNCDIKAKGCSGLLIGDPDNIVPTDANVHNLMIRSDAAENTKSGILLYGTDNNINNVRSYYFGINVDVMVGGQFLSDVHTLASGDGGSNQVAYHLHNADCYLSNCYGDSEETCFKMTGNNVSSLFLCNFFYYSYRANKTTVFDVESSARIKVSGMHVNCRAGNVHVGIKIPYNTFPNIINGLCFDVDGLIINGAQYMQDGDPLKGMQTNAKGICFLPTQLTNGSWYKVGSLAAVNTSSHVIELVSNGGRTEIPLSIHCASDGTMSADVASGRIVTTDSGVYQIGYKLQNSGFDSTQAYPLIGVYIKRTSGASRTLYGFNLWSNYMAQMSPSGGGLETLATASIVPDVVATVDCNDGTVGN